MNELKKWKILTTILVAIAIISASFAGYYAHQANEIEERNEKLMKLGLSKIGLEFGQIAHPQVFESYPYPYPITPERIKGLKYQHLTEENTDAFLYQLYYWCSCIYCDLRELSGERCELGEVCSNSEEEALYQLKRLIGRGWPDSPSGLTGKYEAISSMTNKTWRKEALEELISRTKDDFGEIGHLLYDGKLSEAAEIAASGEARHYLDQPAYPIAVAVDKYEYQIGENITFWIRNNWDRTIELPAPPYVIQKDVGPTTSADGGSSHTVVWQKIYEPTETQAVNLKPGEKKEWIWNQKNANGTQVGAGYYKVVFSVDGWAEETYSDTFMIEEKD
jgi:uncharacterized cupredoxin-like copper-binding protein